jgi:hypothetical protein
MSSKGVGIVIGVSDATHGALAERFAGVQEEVLAKTDLGPVALVAIAYGRPPKTS